MVTIGTRAKQLRISCIVSISLLGFFMLLFGGLLIGLSIYANRPSMSLTVTGLLIFVELLFGGILAWQIVILVAILRCPEELVSQDGDTFRIFAKDHGYTAVPCASVVMVKPVNAMWTAGWIGIASGRYDATLEVTTSDGRNYRIPYVRLAPSVADAMMRIAYEVRMRKQIEANAPQPVPETAQPQPTDESK